MLVTTSYWWLHDGDSCGWHIMNPTVCGSRFNNAEFHLEDNVINGSDKNSVEQASYMHRPLLIHLLIDDPEIPSQIRNWWDNHHEIITVCHRHGKSTRFFSTGSYRSLYNMWVHRKNCRNIARKWVFYPDKVQVLHPIQILLYMKMKPLIPTIRLMNSVKWGGFSLRLMLRVMFEPMVLALLI